MQQEQLHYYLFIISYHLLPDISDSFFILVHLNLSSGLDAAKHILLKSRLKVNFGVSSIALDSVRPNLRDHSQFVWTQM